MYPLITVQVITYNSSKFVIETLNSIYDQTYENIELIISDDCSVDNTIELCKNWLDSNKIRFKSSQLLIADRNTGTSSNINRAIRVSNGTWIKSIAGDDILLPNCIMDNFEFTRKNEDISILQSNSYLINEQSEIIGTYKVPTDKYFFSSQISPTYQFKILLRKYIGNPNSLFIKKSVYDKCGLNDESIPLIEDSVMFLKVTSSGYKLYFMEKTTVKYRIHSGSVSSRKQLIVSPLDISHSKSTYVKHYLIPNIGRFESICHLCHLKISKMFFNTYFNNETILNRFLWRLIAGPFMLVFKIKVNLIHLHLSYNTKALNK